MVQVEDVAETAAARIGHRHPAELPAHPEHAAAVHHQRVDRIVGQARVDAGFFAHFGDTTEVEVKEGLRASKEATVFAIESAQRKADLAAARAAVESHPLVREIETVLGAELRDVKLPGDGD